jgi:hypothetical protein
VVHPRRAAAARSGRSAVAVGSNADTSISTTPPGARRPWSAPSPSGPSGGTGAEDAAVEGGTEVPPASAAGQMAISSPDPVRAVYPSATRNAKFANYAPKFRKYLPSELSCGVNYLTICQKGVAETTCTEWQQECRSAGIYLHFFRLTITQIAGPRWRTVDARAVIVVDPGEAQSPRLRARGEPSG